MRKLTIAVLIILLSTFSLIAQNASVEKSIFGLQLGVNPWNIYYEGKLFDDISLHTEIGIGGSFYKNRVESYYEIHPSFVLEPRYYYNLNRRVSKGKNISGNSANYFAIMAEAIPDFYISNGDLHRWYGISLMPCYGLRRRVGKWFEYELGFGIGYQWGNEKYQYLNYGFWDNPETKANYNEKSDGLVYYVRLGIGFGI